MSLENELVTRLLADSGVSTLVSTRVWALRGRQNPTYPFLVYQRISGPRLDHLSGASDFGTARIQIDCYAATYAGAKALAAAVQASLHGFNGTLTTLRAAIRLDNEIDDLEDEASQEGVWRVTQDYLIQHSE